jgi:hypothetical protein
MKDLPGRSWAFLMAVPVLAVLAVRGLVPYEAVAGLIVVVGLILRIEWFIPGALAFWAFLAVPFLVALGVPESLRDRMAVLFLTLMATALCRLIGEVRGAAQEADAPEGAKARSPNGPGRPH